MNEHRHEWLPNTISSKTPPNMERVQFQYANGAKFKGFFSTVDGSVVTEHGAPQARIDYRWAPIQRTH